jgi:diguanylate cyclase (GGDEF)-like protein
MEQGSWLFPDGVDRERMLDLDRHLRPVRRAVFAVLAVALVVCGPWLGWWTLVPLALAVILFRFADTQIDRLERPEYWLLGSWMTSQAIVAVSVALTGGPTVPTMAWLAIPVMTLGARFSERGIVVGIGFSLVLLLAVAFGVDADAVVANPTYVVAPAAMLIAVALFQTVLMRSELKHRAAAVLDPLTGMLNRKALGQRVLELAQQSRITAQPIGLIVADIDHFKHVNDTHGHAAGDAVLRAVAHELRGTLRAFDLLYRTGGEEFLVLLPGAGVEAAVALAEAMRAGIEAAPLGGHRVTMSFGAAASAPGEVFDFEAVFGAADAALYEAKHGGRNRVCPPPAAALAA